MKNAKLIVVTVLVTLTLIVGFQNIQAVSMRLLFWEARMSLTLLVLLTAAVAFTAGLLAARWFGRRRLRH